MRTLHALHHFTTLTRFVLAWFVLSLGIAIASPIVKPQDILLVCSSSGAMKVVITMEDGETSYMGNSTMDCPLCISIAAPPPPIANPYIEPIQPLAYALQGIPSAHIAARTAAPLPARGPPQHT